MLTRDFEQAEELSTRHSVQELDAMDTALNRKATLAALIGLASMLLVFFGPDVARAIGYTDLDPRVIMLPAGVGVLIYLVLNGRYKGRQETVALAKKLRLRADAGVPR